MYLSGVALFYFIHPRYLRFLSMLMLFVSIRCPCYVKCDFQFKPKIKISNRDYFGSIIGNTGALDNDNFGQSYSSMGDYSNYGGGNSVNNVGDYYYIYDDDDFYYYDDVPYYVEQAKRARGTTERRRAPTRVGINRRLLYILHGL